MGQPTSVHSPGKNVGEVRLLAQAIVVLAFAAAAISVGWVFISGGDWYAPVLALIVAARFAYDHFFSA